MEDGNTTGDRGLIKLDTILSVEMVSNRIIMKGKDAKFLS